MKIALGSDHAGFALKSAIKEHLEGKGLCCYDYGAFDEKSVDYPDQVPAVVDAVRGRNADLGVLICGTGIGMSIAANKHKGIRAALCGDTYSAVYARAHNDANIITLGSRVMGVGLALVIVDAFLESSFEGGRHSQRVDKIRKFENN